MSIAELMVMENYSFHPSSEEREVMQIDGEKRMLSKKISRFFGNGVGIHIAVVCGDTHPWDLDKFQCVLQENRAPRLHVRAVTADRIPTDGQGVRCGCAVVSKNTLSEALSEVANVLCMIQEGVGRSREGRDAFRKLDQYIAGIRTVEAYRVAKNRVWSREHAEELTTAFSEVSEASNYFQELRFLIYLPRKSFQFFKKGDHFFPEQIKMVVLCKKPKKGSSNRQTPFATHSNTQAAAVLDESKTVDKEVMTRSSLLQQQ